MKCPYNKSVATTIQIWKQNSDENQTHNNGINVTQTISEFADCQKENCGAWDDGRCHYANNQT